LIKLSSEFRTRIIDDYFRNESWKKIIHTINQNETLDENVAELSFVRDSNTVSREFDSYMTSNIDSKSSKSVPSSNETQKNPKSSKSVLSSNETQENSRSSKSLSRSNENHDNQHDKNLIYHVNKSTKEKRLCISSDCVANILVVAHEHEQEHSNFEITFEIISRSWYIRDLIKTLRAYIKNCSQCLQIQIRRHRSWENLQLIHSSSISFHTITMNFVLKLLKVKEIDCILSVIDKFTKRVMLISEKFIYTVEDWAINLLEKSQRRNWEISKMIIFDRDRKFLSDLWRILFVRLSVFMLYFTAYHSQTNDVSERTNQTLKIALRYYIQKLHDFTLWIAALWKFQFVFNNTRSILTKKTSNELLYEITSNLLLNISSSNKIVDNHTQLRKKAQNVIDWAQMINKTHYDRRHSSLFLKIDEWTMLRLHHDYSISESKNMIKKISTQYVKSFKVVQRIKRLAYRLVISEDWKMHSIFSIVQLESASDSAQNFYNRFKSIHSSSVIDSQEYEIERLLNKRIIKRELDFFTEYLVRWQNYESEYDRWYNIKNLENVKDLIADYEKKLFNSFNWLVHRWRDYSALSLRHRFRLIILLESTNNYYDQIHLLNE
jgi:hypothetical protein